LEHEYVVLKKQKINNMKKFKQFTLGLLLTTSFSYALSQETTTEISDEELKTFVAVQQEIEQENVHIQNEMVEVIKNNDLTIERFNEIYEGQMNPEKTVEMNDSEKSTYDVVMTEIQKIQEGFQSKAGDIMNKNNMSPEDYQKVYVTIQSDSSLQDKYQELMEK
jgi:hypothetical protein